MGREWERRTRVRNVAGSKGRQNSEWWSDRNSAVEDGGPLLYGEGGGCLHSCGDGDDGENYITSYALC
jgi:hypothetical protein